MPKEIWKAAERPVGCDDAFSAIGEVLAVLKSEGMKAPLRMVEPSLEDAFVFFVRNGEVN